MPLGRTDAPPNSDEPAAELRRRAMRLRRLARDIASDLDAVSRLVEFAQELEARAAQVEAASPSGHG